MESIPRYYEIGEQCVTGESPMIKDVIKAYEDVDSLDAWLTKMMVYFCDASHIDASTSLLQIGMTIQMVKARYSGLKLAEMMLFANKFLAGDYEKFYKDFDMQAVTRSLAKFMEFRNAIIAKHDKSEMNLNLSYVDGAENYKIYLDKLMKAAMGDKKAYEYLRIESRKDLAVCCAMCVRRNDFPVEVIGLFPDFKDVMDEIVNGDFGLRKVS